MNDSLIFYLGQLIRVYELSLRKLHEQHDSRVCQSTTLDKAKIIVLLDQCFDFLPFVRETHEISYDSCHLKVGPSFPTPITSPKHT